MSFFALFSFFSFSLSYSHITLFLLSIVFLIDLILKWRQRNAYAIKKRPNELSDEIVLPDKFLETQNYGADKINVAIWSDCFELVKLWMVIGFELLSIAWMWTLYVSEDRIVRSILFLFGLSFVDQMLGLPLSLYSTFVVEVKHGFNKQSIGLFFSDWIKTLLLSVLLGSPILALFILVVEWCGEFFYIYVCLLMLTVQLIGIFLYPNFIQPCFNQVKPLEDSELKTKIEELCSNVDFPLKSLFKIDGSVRSSHSNAYQYGFCSARHIVVYDTLIEQASVKEIVAIVAHELGHYKHSHTIRMLFYSQLQILLLMFLFGFSLNSRPFYQDFGFDDQPVLIGLILFSFLYTPIDHLVGFAMHYVSRSYEFQADEFAVSLGLGKDLSSGLIKLQRENKSAFCPDWLYSQLYYSHPPLLERLRAIDFHLSKRENKLE